MEPHPINVILFQVQLSLPQELRLQHNAEDEEELPVLSFPEVREGRDEAGMGPGGQHRSNHLWSDVCLCGRKEATGGASGSTLGFGVNPHEGFLSQSHLNTDRMESNLSVPGFQGCHENALIKGFKTSPYVIYL